MVNKAFEDKKTELIEKYMDEIKGISEKNNSDIFVSFYMLVQNATNILTGQPLYEGAPDVNYDELRDDIADWGKLRRQQ